MNLQKIQKLLRKAIRDYELVGNIDEETLVAFLSVDILREESTTEIPTTPRGKRGTSYEQ